MYVVYALRLDDYVGVRLSPSQAILKVGVSMYDANTLGNFVLYISASIHINHKKRTCTSYHLKGPFVTSRILVVIL